MWKRKLRTPWPRVAILTEGGRPGWLAGARGAETQYPLGPVHSLEALPYCGEVLEGKSGGSFGQCGGWW